jgi:lipid-A-disaccharide synthase
MTNVAYVGHPLAGQVRVHCDREEFCRAHDLHPARPLIALLPGSRHKELVRILPPLLDAAAVVTQQNAAAQFVLVVAPSRSTADAESILKQHNATSQITLRLVHNETREALAAADAAAVASGTATLEAALLGTPMVIVYKESAINWHTLGSLITAEHYGLVNLIAGKRLVTELMQNDLNGERLARELISLLDRERNQTLRKQLKEVAALLGTGGASQRAAEAVVKFLR